MVCTVHTTLHNQMPEYIAIFCESKTKIASGNTRECALKIPNRKLDISHRGRAYQNAVLYNDLNTNITNAPTTTLQNQIYS